MTTRLISRNGGEELPVTLAEMLDWLKRTDTDEDDDLIESCLLAAIDWAERFTGLIMIDSTFDQVENTFPGGLMVPMLQPPLSTQGPIYLRRGPVLEILSVSYRDASSASASLSSSSYRLDDVGGRLYLPASGTWPTTDAQGGAVTVRYRAGFIDMTGSPSPDGDIPETFKAAIKLYAAEIYGNRDNEREVDNSSRVPYGAEALLRLHRIDDSLA